MLVHKALHFLETHDIALELSDGVVEKGEPVVGPIKIQLVQVPKHLSPHIVSREQIVGEHRDVVDGVAVGRYGKPLSEPGGIVLEGGYHRVDIHRRSGSGDA